MDLVRRLLRAFTTDSEGATAIEYGLIVSLIFLVIVSAVSLFAGNMTVMFGLINAAIGGAL
jgi:pilus assembly protein Flp/PilA